MGLDIYLSTVAEHEASVAHDRAWEAVCPSWGAMTEDERTAWHEANPWPSHRSDVPSHEHPDHYCNRRYLRSSYNGAGFNRAATEMLGDDDASFYGIFDPIGDLENRERLTADDLPSLAEARRRALGVAARLRALEAPLRTMDAGPVLGSPDHLWSTLPRDREVLAWYRERLAKSRSLDGWYSDGKGLVLSHGDTPGLEILALTAGVGALGQPCAIAIYRDTAGRDYLAATAEIAAEFCDEAATLVEADGIAYWTWSG